MKRFLGVALVAVASFYLAAEIRAQSKENLQKFMRAKLEHSQEVLEGLVVEDFDKVATGSQAMSLLSLAEQWQVLETPEYVEFSRKFRAAADNLTEIAKKKDLEKSTQAFNLVTTRCVECHKYVRGVRMAQVGTLPVRR